MKRLTLGFALSLTLFGTTLIAPAVDARGFGKAGVVVVHGDGSVRTDCVRLDRPTITGFRLLAESKFPFAAARFEFGKAICRIDGEGPKTESTEDCFSDPEGRFWGYWTQEKGEAAPDESQVGAGDRAVTRGDVDYWVWDTFPQDAPPPHTLRQICA